MFRLTFKLRNEQVCQNNVPFDYSKNTPTASEDFKLPYNSFILDLPQAGEALQGWFFSVTV